jgi:Tol biopolymer transport system component
MRFLILIKRAAVLIIISLYAFSCNTVEPPTPLPEYDSIDEAPAWSPDGGWIAYHHFNKNPEDSLYPTGLYIIDTNGNNRRLVISGPAYNPDWSPDGNEIAFTNGNVNTVNIDSKEIIQLTANGSDFFPKWMPDRTKISFDRSGTIDTVGTWFFDLSTFTEMRFGLFPQLDWSKNGEKIVFSGKSENKNSESQIWTASSDGIQQQKLTTNNFSYNRYPKWSTDNNKISWEILRNNQIYPEVWVMNADGNSQMKLTDGSYPSWSPDNEKIVYSKPVNNKIALFIIDIETNITKQLTNWI